LAELFLIPDSSLAGEALDVQWLATSTAVSGAARGVLEISVAEEIVGLDRLRLEIADEQ
jgi:hypothetical protein